MQIARQLGLTNATVGKWRRRFVEQDVSGLHDELRPGRPRPISDERVEQLVRKTLEAKPKDARTGRSGKSPNRRDYQNRRCIAFGRSLDWGHTDNDSSSFRTIHFL
jgi:transposase